MHFILFIETILQDPFKRAISNIRLLFKQSQTVSFPCCLPW